MKKLSILFFLLFTLFSKISFSQSYDFELPDLDGNNVKLSQLLQKGPVMISFWALWCVPCKEEMRVMGDIYNKYKDSGFVYIAMNQDSPKSSSKVKSYIESKNYKFLVLLDSDTHIFDTFGGQNIPFGVLMNKKGEVVKTYTGYIPGDETKLEEDIVNVLKSSK
jgi:cytochrome c biogenesis protein CcmG/thiol:disulfide interchange protein DsbE